jgi:hypothetical protein
MRTKRNRRKRNPTKDGNFVISSSIANLLMNTSTCSLIIQPLPHEQHRLDKKLKNVIISEQKDVKIAAYQVNRGFSQQNFHLYELDNHRY